MYVIETPLRPAGLVVTVTGFGDPSYPCVRLLRVSVAVALLMVKAPVAFEAV